MAETPEPAAKRAKKENKDEPAPHLGRIVQMTVENFKSYRGAQVIGPFHSFTAIIGPNGSGKSNLMDAVSFVLGVRTAQLRGKLSDLLYNNTDLGPSFERPRRGAVKLLFQSEKGDMVEFSRHIVPSGSDNYSSQYRIDGENVGWDAYNEKLKGFGILVKARNFLVFQGDIESVAGMQPTDLTNLVEQIAGTDALKDEYENLELAKQHSEEKTSYLFSKKKNVSLEKRQMKEQKDEAEKHIRLEKELAELKEEHYLWQLYHCEQDSEKVAGELERLKVELHAKSELVAGVEAEVKEKRQAQAGISKKRVLLEKTITGLRSQRDSQVPALMEIKAEVERVTRRIQKGKRDLEAQAANKARMDAQQAKQHEDMESITAAMKEHEANKDITGNVKLTEQQRAEFRQLEEKAGAAAFKLTQEMDDLKSQQKGDETRLENLMRQDGQTKNRLETLAKDCEKAKEEQSRLQEKQEKDQQSVGEKKHERRKLSEQSRTLGAQRDALDQNLQVVEAKLRDARADRRDNDRERKMKESVANMKTILPGVLGRLTELGEVTNRKYNVALSVLLGRHMDSVVVDNDKTARECVQYLKEHRIFPMTFIPMQNLKVSPINERLRQLGGSVKLAMDVVQYDKTVENAFVHVLENSLVCDTLDEARRLGYHSGEKLKVCACDGTLINRNGNITGGGSSSMEDRASRWDHKAVDLLKTKRDELQAGLKALPDVREVRNQEQCLAAEISGLEHRMKFKDEEIMRLTSRIAKMESEAQRWESSATQHEPELRSLNTDVKERATKISSLEKKIGAIHNTYFKEFSDRLGVPNVHEHMEAYEKQVAEHKKAEARFKTQLAHVKNHMDLIAKQLGDVMAKMQSIQETMDADKAAIKTFEAKEAEIVEETANLEASIATEQEEIQKLQAQIDASEEELTNIQREASKSLAEVNKIRRAISSKETQQETLAVARCDILEAASMDQIALPHLSQNGTAAPADVDGAGEEEPIEPQGQLDFSRLKRSQMTTTSQSDRDALEEEFKSSIEDLANTLEKHNPNMRALEQYDQIKAKEQLQQAELDAAKADAKAATEAFNNLRSRRHQLFTEAFNHISTSIDPIYKELTKSKAHQLGGTAYLSLENPDEPFLHGIKYTAMPPSKRFRDMEQLSGGEKTIAALSLLFAIHSFKPSPFFVLDECDAALDATNVARIAAFVRSRSRKTAQNSCQSIVISLKDIFYEQADALVGVSKDLRKGSSATYTLDLNRFS